MNTRLMWFRVQSWLAWRWQARGIYAAHSPRIFQLYRKVLRNKNVPASLDKWRNQIRRDATPLQFTELGAGRDAVGSRTIRTSVGRLARRSGAGRWKARVLYQLVRQYQPAHVLELGTNLGISAGYLAAALPENARLTTVEGVPELAGRASLHLDQLTLKAKVRLVNQTFEAYLDTLTNERFGLVYLDGHHAYRPTLDYIRRLKPHLAPGALVVLDDIYWSPGMAAAWSELCADDDFSVSADLFRLGLLYYRVRQAPQHFMLKP